MKVLFALIFGVIIGWFSAVFSTQKVEQKVVEKYIEKVVYKTANTATHHNTISKTTEDEFSPKSIFTKISYLVQQENYQQALDFLTDLIYQVQDVYDETELKTLFLNISKKVLDGLANSTEKVRFLRDVLNTLPSNLELRYLLATELVKIKEYVEAEYQLSFLAYQPNFKAKFDALIKKIQYNKIFTSGEVHIPIVKKDNAWYIDAVINNNKVVLILDTGATQTTIADKFLSNNSKAEIGLSTANGLITGNVYQKNTLKIGEIIDENMDIIGLPKSKLPKTIDGLLGLDWLERFNFIIDVKNNMLRLISK